jgi:hypothetical protein
MSVELIHRVCLRQRLICDEVAVQSTLSKRTYLMLMRQKLEH